MAFWLYLSSQKLRKKLRPLHHAKFDSLFYSFREANIGEYPALEILLQILMTVPK